MASSKDVGRKFFVGGNWKMNGSKKIIDEVNGFLNAVNTKDESLDIVCAPPAVWLSEFIKSKPNHVQAAGQNCYKKENGAFTGETSPQMLEDLKCQWVILGHSERRTIFKETDDEIAEKAKFVLEHTKLSVIFCIGETLEEREQNKTNDIVTRQLNALKQKIGDSKDYYDRIVVAYEPVWAIGTGKTATPEQAQEVHKFIRDHFLKTEISEKCANVTRIIYGGSVTGKNCADLAKKPDIDGFLVGGASLKQEFTEICNSWQQNKSS